MFTLVSCAMYYLLGEFCEWGCWEWELTCPVTCGVNRTKMRVRHCRQMENVTGSHKCDGFEYVVEPCEDIPCRPNIQDLRLPTHLKPEKYTIELIPFVGLGNFTFQGHVEIIMVCKEESRNVTFFIYFLKKICKN